MEQVKVFSFGGGVQSTAVLVLAARREVDFQTFVFCNVGEDSENPDTLTYVEQYARPYAEAHGLEFVELRKRVYGGPESLLHYTCRRKRQVPLPCWLRSGTNCNRTCTYEFKIRVVGSFTVRRGARRKNVAINGMGISTDEAHRCRTYSVIPWQMPNYPLIDLNLSREDCERLIASEGLPVPPKSSCWFCPFHRPEQWVELRAQHPDLFERALELEDMLNRRRELLGRDPVSLHASGLPLGMAVDRQEPVAGMEFAFCDSGHCMT
ncbi:MAG: hypothetical protein U0X20_22050 [Caldilineaceae bacterium]